MLSAEWFNLFDRPVDGCALRGDDDGDDESIELMIDDCLCHPSVCLVDGRSVCTCMGCPVGA